MLVGAHDTGRTTAPPATVGDVDGLPLTPAQIVRLAKLIHCIWHADTSLDGNATMARAVGALRATMRLVDGRWTDLPSLALPGGRRLRLTTLDEA